MQRATGPGATAAGYYTNGGPSGGGVPTVANAPDFNATQEEVCRFIESQGIALALGPTDPSLIDETHYLQLQEAIARASRSAGSANKNLLINPSFTIAQRGPGPWNDIGVTPTFTADRWEALGDGPGGTGRLDIQRTTFFPGYELVDQPRHELVIAQTVVSDQRGAAIRQKIERAGTASGETLTLSFWAKSTSPMSLTLRFTQNFGTGGSPSTSTVINAGTVALTTTYARYSVTVDIPSISGETLGTDGNDYLMVELEIPIGTSPTFTFANAQVERGRWATPFEARDEGDELRLCRRYYEKSFAVDDAPVDVSAANVAALGIGVASMSSILGTGAAGLGFCASQRFLVEKRAEPDVYWYTGYSPTLTPGTFGSVTVQDGGTSVFGTRPVDGMNGKTKSSTGYPLVGGITTLADGDVIYAHWTADAEL